MNHALRDQCLAIAFQYIKKYKIRYRWKKTDSPTAWPDDRRIECRRPTSPWYLALCLHEIAHCVNGMIYPRWWDDFVAWYWVKEQLQPRGLWDKFVSSHAADSMAQTIAIFAVSAGWDHAVPDWLYKAVGLDHGKIAKDYARRRKPIPPTWEPCLCRTCERARRKK
jgi:hypothetical protein